MSESLGFFTHFYGRLLAPTWRYHFDERGDTAKAQWPAALVPRPDTLKRGEEALKKGDDVASTRSYAFSARLSGV